MTTTEQQGFMDGYLCKEAYDLPFAVGDTILAGHFKNQRRVVKGFGTGKHNQPVLITDKGAVPLFSFRVKKLMTEKTSAEAEPMPPYRASQLRRYFLGEREYPYHYFEGESQEFREALEAKKLADINEELQDVMFAAQMLAYHRTGQDRRIVGANPKIREFIDRRNVLSNMFASRGVPFDVKHLAAGSNWRKPAKIMAAFESAGAPISLEDATKLRDAQMQNSTSASVPAAAVPDVLH